MSGKYQQLTDLLESRIAEGKLAPGERLPSLREWVQQGDFSLDMVRRALNLLCAKGLIEARHGDGFYVVGRRRIAGRRQIAVIYHAEEGLSDSIRYSSVVLNGMQEEAARREVSLLVHYGVSLYTPCAEIEALFANSQAEAAILLGTFDRIPREWHCRIPLVGVAMDACYDGLLSPINLDPWQTVSLALDFFRQRGVRRLRLFQANECAKGIRIELLERFWDGEVEIVPLQWNTPLPDDFPADTGYYFDGGTEAERMSRHFRQRFGQSLAAERTVLAVDGKSLLNPHYEPLPVIAPDWLQIGHFALREGLRRLEEPGSGMCRIGARGRLIMPEPTSL